MEKADHIFEASEEAKKEAEKYFKSCELFCNSLAERIKTDLGCRHDCQYNVEPEPKEKQQVLVMSFDMPQGKNFPVRFLVRKSDDNFLVKIDGSNKEFTVPEKATMAEQFAPILDATYTWLENIQPLLRLGRSVEDFLLSEK